MILTAAADQHRMVVWLMLLFASAGVFDHSGIKIPFFAFFAHDSGRRVKEAPWNMLAAMAIAAALCILIGVFPGPLYSILPFKTSFSAYDTTHVITQLQLLMWAGLAFTVLMITRIYPPELRSVNLDTDWFYRRPFKSITTGSISPAQRMLESARAMRASINTSVLELLTRSHNALRGLFGDHGALSSTRSISAMVVWVALLLTAYLILYYTHM